MDNIEALFCSFRDPDGCVFRENGLIFRKVKKSYQDNYDYLMGSGLYSELVEAGLLIPHKEITEHPFCGESTYKIIMPRLIPFISYPYEWCFSQLKKAALLTLEIQRRAINFGMTLKDSSAYNVQFLDGKPIFIDTLSFERFREGSPWGAYRQFCEHFLAPLVLMKYKDPRLNKLSQVYINGIPLDLTSKILAFNKAGFKLSIFLHLYLHALSQKYFANKPVDTSNKTISRLSLMGLIDNLYSMVKGINWKPERLGNTDYYKDTNYCQEAFRHKKELLTKFIDDSKPDIIWDFGANTGLFSRVAAEKGILTVSLDHNHADVEKNYLQCIDKGQSNCLPLLVDLFNPSPSIGWENEERLSFLERGPADTGLALALIHHLVISNNLPFDKISGFFSKACRKTLIIEFVPKEDSYARKLLAGKEGFPYDYTQQTFEEEFKKYFVIERFEKIKDSKRIIYLMRKR